MKDRIGKALVWWSLVAIFLMLWALEADTRAIYAVETMWKHGLASH